MTTVKNPKNVIKCLKPAGWWGSTWREALPTGNGKIGAAVYGGPASDTIMITHSGLWWQGHVGVLPDVADKLKDTRKYLDNDKPFEAEKVLSNALISKSYRPQAAYPLPLCDLKVEMSIGKQVKEYFRQLNMENGEVSVNFKDGASKFDRSVFVSRFNDLIVYEITKTGSKSIDVKLSFDQHDKFNARTRDGISKTPEGVMTKYENFFLYFSARSDTGNEFGAVAHIKHFGGTQKVLDDGIVLSGCEKVLVLIRTFVESGREKEWKSGKTELGGVKLTYDKLLKEHAPLHNRIFSSVELELDCENRDMPVDMLIREAAISGEASPALLEKLYAFSSFLMTAGAGEGQRPLSSYGIWCGDYKGEFAGINSAGSIQTIYGNAMQAGLHPHIEALFSYYESVIDDLKKNASRLYLCRGIFVPPTQAHGTGLIGNTNPADIHTTYIAGWIGGLMYDYFLYTDDVKFLKNRALPFMKEVATFYEEFFKIGANNQYDSYPSYSGSTPGNLTLQAGSTGLQISQNSTIDFAVARELLTNLISGSEIAGINKGDIEKWRHMVSCVPEHTVGSDGTISEFSDSRYTDNPYSPSLSRYYSVYPSVQDTENPELVKVFATTYKKQFESSKNAQNTLSLVRGANLLARLGDGEGAKHNIDMVVRGMMMDNLITTSHDRHGYGVGEVDGWSRYTLEGNMGIASAISEMLIQSTASAIKILPALPDALSKGELSDIHTRIGVTVTLSWDMKRGVVTAKLKSKKARMVDIYLPNGVSKYKKIGGEKFIPEQNKIDSLILPAGKIITLELKM